MKKINAKILGKYFFQKIIFYTVKKRLLGNIIRNWNICGESTKIINYSAQSDKADPGQQYLTWKGKTRFFLLKFNLLFLILFLDK
jgi:hypothetical protein